LPEEITAERLKGLSFARAKHVLLRFGPLQVEPTGHCAALLAHLAFEVVTTRWPPFSPGKISMLWSFFATLGLLPERAGLHALFSLCGEDSSANLGKTGTLSRKGKLYPNQDFRLI